MPMKWDAENDRTLFFLIFKNLGVNVDAKTAKAIADQWPNGQGERPTPRAITERFGKIRTSLKTPGNGTISQMTSGASTPRKSTASAASTPRKPPASATPSKKRKVNSMTDGDDDDSDAVPAHIPARELSALESPNYRSGNTLFATHTSTGHPVAALASPHNKLRKSMCTTQSTSRDLSPSSASRATYNPNGTNGMHSVNGTNAYASPVTVANDNAASFNSFLANGNHTPTSAHNGAAGKVVRPAVGPESPTTPRVRSQRAASARVASVIKQEGFGSEEETGVSGLEDEDDGSEYNAEMEV